MTDRSPVLDVRNLRVQFLGVKQPAIDGISFALQPGQTLGIVGESGSGKSVTSLAVMGLLPSAGKVTQGEVWFQGHEKNDGTPQPIDLLSLVPSQLSSYRGSQMAMIFQEPMTSLNPVFTIGYQLVEAISQHQSLSAAEARRQAVYVLQEVKLIPGDDSLREQYLTNIKSLEIPADVPSDRELNDIINHQKLSWLERYPHELSGGQLQRVTIAMAISCNPTLLIADEPTTALDVTVQATILELLQELRDRREMSMIFITHDLGIIAEIADVVAVMYKGQIVECKPILELFQNPTHPYTKSLLACRPRPDRSTTILPTIKDFMEERVLANGSIEILEKPQPLSVVMQDTTIDNRELRVTDLDDRWRSLSERESTPILAVNNLKVGFPARGMFGKNNREYTWAVNDISFNVYSGETLGLVGESGCGKSTLARTILRLIEPQSGSIHFQGQDITTLRGEQMQILRRELQIVFQNPFSALNPRMSICDLIVEPLVIHKTLKSKAQRQERAEYLLQRVGLLPDYLKLYPHQLSGGQRQRVCIARALALNPKFIICDESVSALDVSVQAQVLNLFKELQAEFNLTYIFISHDLSVVKFMSDRIMVMNQGKIEEINSAENVYRSPQTAYTRKLISSIPLGTIDRIIHQQSNRELSNK